VDIGNWLTELASGRRAAEWGKPSERLVKECLAAVSVTFGLASQGRWRLDESNLFIERFRRAARLQLPKAPGKQGGGNWRVNDVLQQMALRDWKILDVPALRQHLVCLLRLDMWWRSSDFTGVFRERMRWQDPIQQDRSTWVSIDIYRPKEWQSTGPSDWTSPVQLVSPSEPWRGSAVDTLAVLARYVSSTSSHAEAAIKTTIAGQAYTPLLVSLNRQASTADGKRYTGLVADTVARMTKNHLAEMGVIGADVEEGPHSTRAVASAKAYRMTGNLTAVATRGRWASAATFLQFYNKGAEVESQGNVELVSSENMADVMRHGMLAPVSITRVLQLPEDANLPKTSPCADTGSVVPENVIPAVQVHKTSRDGDLIGVSARKGRREQPDREKVDPTVPGNVGFGTWWEFEPGVWSDAPGEAIRGKVIAIDDSEISMSCDYDGSILQVEWPWMLRKISQGKAMRISHPEEPGRARGPRPREVSRK
jgi:hypothetical protein